MGELPDPVLGVVAHRASVFAVEERLLGRRVRRLWVARCPDCGWQSESLSVMVLAESLAQEHMRSGGVA